MTELQALLRSGAISAKEALAAQVLRGQLLNSRFNCVVDQLKVDLNNRGPLSGIALAHKDIFQLHDRLPGLGVSHGIPQTGLKPAAAIKALQKAGASQWASLVMAPHACGATSQNSNFIRCINPLDENATVGGSSSGSAVAVASGMSYVALGTDTAGSIRIPAATCGLIGLKTTHGAVSTEGCTPLSPSLDSIGIISRYAEDLREVWSVLCPNIPQSNTKSNWKCHIWLPENEVDNEVAVAIKRWLSELTIKAQPIDITDEFTAISRHSLRVLFHETALTHRASLLNGLAEPGVKAIGLMGLGLPENWYKASIESRSAFLTVFVNQHFRNADFLIIPSFSCTVPNWSSVEVGHPNFDRSQLFGMHRYMSFVNYLGLPSLNLPISKDSRGRPICLQVISRPYGEHRLLNFAEQFNPI